jgi:hypothetical protein
LRVLKVPLRVLSRFFCLQHLQVLVLISGHRTALGLMR